MLLGMNGLLLMALGLCVLYAIINCLGMLIHFGIGMGRVNLISNVYAYFLTAPVKLALVLSVISDGTIALTTVTLFALVYFIWQMIYLTSEHQVHAFSIIVPVSIINIISWFGLVGASVLLLAKTVADVPAV